MKSRMTKITALMSCLLAFTFINAMPTKANCTDTTWVADHDYWRQKENATGIYVLNEGLSSTYVTVKGRYLYDTTLYDDVKTNPVTGYTVNTTNVCIGSGFERRIWQYVYERGYYYAHVHFSSGTSGKWSPDTCNGDNIPYANQ